MKDKVTCCYCEKRLSKASHSREHIVPLSKGGRNEPINILPCCKVCNGNRGNKELWEWREELLKMVTNNSIEMKGRSVRTIKTMLKNIKAINEFHLNNWHKMKKHDAICSAYVDYSKYRTVVVQAPKTLGIIELPERKINRKQYKP